MIAFEYGTARTKMPTRRRCNCGIKGRYSRGLWFYALHRSPPAVSNQKLLVSDHILLQVRLGLVLSCHLVCSSGRARFNQRITLRRFIFHSVPLHVRVVLIPIRKGHPNHLRMPVWTTPCRCVGGDTRNTIPEKGFIRRHCGERYEVEIEAFFVHNGSTRRRGI